MQSLIRFPCHRQVVLLPEAPSRRDITTKPGSRTSPSAACGAAVSPPPAAPPPAAPAQPAGRAPPGRHPPGADKWEGRYGEWSPAAVHASACLHALLELEFAQPFPPSEHAQRQHPPAAGAPAGRQSLPAPLLPRRPDALLRPLPPPLRLPALPQGGPEHRPRSAADRRRGPSAQPESGAGTHSGHKTACAPQSAVPLQLPARLAAGPVSRRACIW